MNNLISIIIPTHNRAHSLPKAIQSVVTQSAGNWELIIIDDGSTDETKKVIQEYLIDERIIYDYQQNAGVSVARNKGVELSRGEYVIFLDSDDKFLPGLLTRLNEEDYTQYDLICWEVSKLINGKPSIWKPEKLEMIYNNITATFLAGSVCYRKDLFLKAGGFDPEMTFGENYELGIRISNLPGLRTKIIHQPFLVYTIKTNNRTSNTNDKKIKSNLTLLHKHQELYKKDSVSYARLQYQIGFLFENEGEDQDALIYFKKALFTRPLYLKALLKTIYLELKLFYKQVIPTK